MNKSHSKDALIIYRLAEDSLAYNVIRILSGEVDLAAGKTVIWAQLTRTGDFSDPRYGRFSITPRMLAQMVSNFSANVTGQDVFVDVAHKPENGAAARVLQLRVEQGETGVLKLMGQLEFTPYGLQSVHDKGYRYLSVEYADNWKDNEQEAEHGATLIGAGLTIRPVVKGMDPLQLAECTDNCPVLLMPEAAAQIEKSLTEEIPVMDKWLKKLAEKLKAAGFDEETIKDLCSAFESQAKTLSGDAGQEALYRQYESMAERVSKQLSEQPGAVINITLPDDAPVGDAPKPLSEADVQALVAKTLADERQRAADEAKQLAATTEAREKLLAETITGAEGITVGVKEKLLKEGKELLPHIKDDAGVRALAQKLVKQGEAEEALEAHRQLKEMGWTGPAGDVRVPRVSVDESNQIKSLQEDTSKLLGLTDMSDGERYVGTGGALQAANQRVAKETLAQFDAQHGERLHKEYKLHEARKRGVKHLAGGSAVIGDAAMVPAIYERTVIQEALYQLVGLNFMNTGAGETTGSTVEFAPSISYPYQYRDVTAAGRSAVRVHEGQAVQRAGYILARAMAYPVPQKLAFELSDEYRYLSGFGSNYDGLSANIMNNARIIAEDTDFLCFNELIWASDEYQAMAVIAPENIGAAFDGTKTVFPLAAFPVVRPRAIYDLAGNQIGSTSNPVVINYSGAPIAEWYNGAPAGTYYLMDYNHGEVSFCDETGAVFAPANGVACTGTYSYATNVFLFDIDLGTMKGKEKWDTFLDLMGTAKTEISHKRYYKPTMALMSETLMNSVETAERFAANFRVPGTDLTAQGRLGSIKSLPVFDAPAPNLWMRDDRCFIGERGISRFRMMKSWTMGELENQKDAQGRFTGKKTAYGDQFIVVDTPEPLKRAYTSIQLYSATGRVAR